MRLGTNALSLLARWRRGFADTIAAAAASDQKTFLMHTRDSSRTCRTWEEVEEEEEELWSD